MTRTSRRSYVHFHAANECQTSHVTRGHQPTDLVLQDVVESLEHERDKVQLVLRGARQRVPGRKVLADGGASVSVPCQSQRLGASNSVFVRVRCTIFCLCIQVVLEVGCCCLRPAGGPS